MPKLDNTGGVTRWQCPMPACRHIWTLRQPGPPAKCPACKKRQP